MCLLGDLMIYWIQRFTNTPTRGWIYRWHIGKITTDRTKGPDSISDKPSGQKSHSLEAARLVVHGTCRVCQISEQSNNSNHQSPGLIRDFKRNLTISRPSGYWRPRCDIFSADKRFKCNVCTEWGLQMIGTTSVGGHWVYHQVPAYSWHHGTLHIWLVNVSLSRHLPWQRSS